VPIINYHQQSVSSQPPPLSTASTPGRPRKTSSIEVAGSEYAVKKCVGKKFSKFKTYVFIENISLIRLSNVFLVEEHENSRRHRIFNDDRQISLHHDRLNYVEHRNRDEISPREMFQRSENDQKIDEQRSLSAREPSQLRRRTWNVSPKIIIVLAVFKNIFFN
jgi:hypothetical protein